MKRTLRIILVCLAVLVAGGIVWWQLSKKGIIRHEIEKAVRNGTDSTYYIHYDSSRIDELAGNAVFYNLVLQSDSLQKELYHDDTSKVPQTIFNVHVEKVSVLGANIPSFLQKNKIAANIIELYRPVITIINTGKEEGIKYTAADTLAIYEKLTGKFNSIQAGEIRIIDGTIAFARGKKSPHTTLQGVNVDLKNLKIDSTRDYNNLLSYFVTDIKATVKTINLKNEKANRLLIFENAEYNAPGRYISLENFLQKDLRTDQTIIDMRNTKISGISTDQFIYNQKIIADSLSVDGGTLTIYSGKKGSGGGTTVELENNFFDEALIRNIRLGSTNLFILNRDNKNAAPVELKNLQFHASGLDSISTGTNIMRLIGNSNWDLSAAGISFVTADKIYKIDLGPFMLDNGKNIITLRNADVTPTLSWQAFSKTLRFQKDIYDLHFKNIKLTGADIQKLITDQAIIADEATMQPLLHISNDRTVDPDTASKIGQYPQQLLQKMATKIYIKTLHAVNANVHYTERGAISGKTGEVVFNNIQATISNLTNIDSYRKKNSVMTMKAVCKFLNMADINSEWEFPLSSPNGAFKLSGRIGGFAGPKLNPVIEPLGMGSVKSGNIRSYTFKLTGDDLRSQGECILLYDGLKIKLLKTGGDKEKDALSLVANVVIKDKNPSGDSPRKGNMAFKRVTTKTFFNLVWKSIFAGAKTSTR